MIYQFTSGGRGLNQFPGGGFGCLLFLVLAAIGGYYIVQGLYSILLWAAPALLVLALIINWRVFPDTLKSWFKTLEANPLNALLLLALAVLVFPFFSLYIFLKAVGYRKLEQLRRQFDESNPPRGEETFVEFEELESTPKTTNTEQEPPEVPIIESAKPAPEKGKQNPYDSFF